MSSLTIYRIYCHGMGMSSLDDGFSDLYIGYVKNSKLPGSIGSNKIASHGFYCLYHSLSLLSIKKTCVKYVDANSLPNFDAAMSDATDIQLRLTQMTSSLSIKRRS
jgi:hypothetical protein